MKQEINNSAESKMAKEGIIQEKEKCPCGKHALIMALVICLVAIIFLGAVYFMKIEKNFNCLISDTNQQITELAKDAKETKMDLAQEKAETQKNEDAETDANKFWGLNNIAGHENFSFLLPDWKMGILDQGNMGILKTTYCNDLGNLCMEINCPVLATGFENYDLLESHSRIIKTKSQDYTAEYLIYDNKDNTKQKEDLFLAVLLVYKKGDQDRSSDSCSIFGSWSTLQTSADVKSLYQGIYDSITVSDK